MSNFRNVSLLSAPRPGFLSSRFKRNGNIHNLDETAKCMSYWHFYPLCYLDLSRLTSILLRNSSEPSKTSLDGNISGSVLLDAVLVAPVGIALLPLFDNSSNTDQGRDGTPERDLNREGKAAHSSSSMV